MTYLDLAAIDYQPTVAVTLLPQYCEVTVWVNHKIVWCADVDQMVTVVSEFEINSPLAITVLAESDTVAQTPVAAVTVDDQNHTQWIQWQRKGKLWTFDSGRAYYEWLHQVTAQGWLLTPRSRPQDNADRDQLGAV